MRELAAYSLEMQRSAGGGSPGDGDRVRHAVESWLNSKGTVADDAVSIALRHGKMAKIERSRIESSLGTASDLILTEPTGGGVFRTSIALAETQDQIAVSVTLSAASSTLSPLAVDVHCPRIVRDLLSPGFGGRWQYRGAFLNSSHKNFTGNDGGDEFIALAWDPNRPVPIVAVSDEYGALLHPGILEALAEDLAGLGIVARLDPSASWRVTARKGKAWSCYGGAMRLYWPGIGAGSEPTSHPLWTPLRLLHGVADTETAAGRIRSQIRRRILGQSAFAVTEPVAFARIRRAARQEELSALQTKSTAGADYKSLADEYFHALLKREAELEERDAQIEELRAQVSSLNVALRWKNEGEDAVEPDLEAPPSTVEEAVLVAMDRCSGTLVFGAAVNNGVKTLAPDAGPPDKILSYLLALSELTESKRKGPLGMTSIKWLEARGVIASGESETIRNSETEQKKRTWDDGAGEKRCFELHLKPSDVTSPDRCARIYFDFDEERQKTIVGWVGAHP